MGGLVSLYVFLNLGHVLKLSCQRQIRKYARYKWCRTLLGLLKTKSYILKSFCFFQIASLDVFSAGYIQIYQLVVNPRKRVISSVGDVLNLVLLSWLGIITFAIILRSIYFVRNMKKEDKNELMDVICKDLKRNYSKKCSIMSYRIFFTLRRMIMMFLLFLN